MIRAVVWKEFREQGLIGLTLIVLGAGVLAAAAAVADPPVPGAGPGDVVRYLGAGRLATLLLAVTAGMVCGGALFAAEREAGTIGFLEALPATRWALWRAKLAAGSALVALQVGAVVAVAAALGLVGTGGWAVAVAVYALLAFCWGVYGSTLARTTLGSVGVAIPAASVATFAFLLPVMLFFHNPRTNMPRTDGALLFLGLMFAAPLAGSALAFTRPDRDRAADDPTPSLPRPARLPAAPDERREPPEPAPPVAPCGRPRYGGWALAWLTARQLARPAAALSAFALVFGVGLLLPPLVPVLLWPGLALAAGVLAGVTAFADEQANGTARFWGEQRLPAGRAWAVKVAAHAAFALWLAALLALPLAVRAQVAPAGPGRGDAILTGVFRSLLFEARNLGPEGWKYLLIPVGYGFAFGHLSGLIFRKAVVATGVGGLVGGAAAALWLPSLLAGGVAFWQVWVPPALVLLTAYRLVRAWSADRLGNPAALGTLAAGGGAAAAAMALGIGYRAAEVPDPGAGAEDVRYVADLPSFDENLAGREFRTAAEQYASAAARAGGPPDRGPRRPRAEDRLDAVAAGVSPADADVARFLADVYEPDRAGGRDTPWPAVAAAAAGHPVGMFEPPALTLSAGGSVTLEHGRRMGVAVLAHGLHRQAGGDPGAFPADLATALALGRSMRNGSIVRSLLDGYTVARTAAAATDRWLERLDGRPDPLRPALESLLADDRAVMTRFGPGGRVMPAEIPAVDTAAPFDPTPHLLAERYVIREQMKAPSMWLPDLLTPGGEDREAAAPVADLVTVAWSVPWERERTRRLVGAGFQGPAGGDFARLTRGRPGAALLTLRTPAPNDLAEHDRQVRLTRRAAIVRLALRLHHAETGAFPPDLQALVPRYLPAVPADPYGDGPLRYRVSGGETFDGVPPRGGGRPAEARRGQPLFWSVGTNGIDEGGKSLPVAPGAARGGADFVFLVPLPPPRP